ncbi:PASTA domain-containing protein [Enterococcus sp. LJL98]
MSDFLSNFTKGQYDGKKQGEEKPKKTEKATDEQTVSQQPENVFERPLNGDLIEESMENVEPMEGFSEPSVEPDPEPTPMRRSKREETSVSRFQTEETEFDPTYKKKQQKKYLLIGIGSVLALLLLFVTYYQLTHVKVPNFVSKEVSEVRTWGNESGVKIEVEQKYDFEKEINQVIEQDFPADKKIRKGKTLAITSSLGPNPDEKIKLADFSKMTKDEASKWIEEQKAENITIIENYDNQLKSGAFIKQEFANKELKAEDYKRKDRLMLYYSKGKEVFEKNIEVPELKGKTLTEAEEWAKKNEAKLKIEKDFSNTIAEGTVISQEIAKGKKIAKDETLVLHVSKGKAIEVPDYSQYTMDEASAIEAKIPVVIKSLYSDSVPYGQFISQSVEAGKQYNETDTIPTVTVVYSNGKPYMKDLRGSVNEGDLPKLFFDEYESKGANVYYSVYYVDSAEPKGTVVEMSVYGQFISSGTTVWIGISLGNLTDRTPEVSEPDADAFTGAMEEPELPDALAEETPMEE